MYRRLMYNDDCILDTTTNTVIFNFEDDWNKYLDWKSQNSKTDKQDFNKRKNILLWNGGLPHKVKDFELFYDQKGCLTKRIEKNKTVYFNNSKIYKEEILKDNKIITEKNYSENEILYREIDYTKKVTKEYDINSGLINCYKKIKGEFTYKAYYKDNILYKSVLIKNNITLRVKEMYPHSTIVKQKTIYLSDSLYEYVDYYRKGNIRGKGVLNLNGKPTGDWKFYHHNNNIESKHKFKNGKLVGSSTLFYENGKPYKEINHD